MTILSQSLFTFVSSHLVALFLFSVWHNFKYLMLKQYFPTLNTSQSSLKYYSSPFILATKLLAGLKLGKS